MERAIEVEGIGHWEFVQVEPLKKGWSGEKKSIVETADGRRFLLRIAKRAEYERMKAQIEGMRGVAELGLPMQQPVDVGLCEGGRGAYQLLSWVEGGDAEGGPAASSLRGAVLAWPESRADAKGNAVDLPFKAVFRLGGALRPKAGTVYSKPPEWRHAL
jgi:aminoglycoside phosphotransferase (APT) family kinase protein